MIDRLSIEVTNQCKKHCDFCYNGSGPALSTMWTPEALVEFVSDCAENGVKAVSFGGGEPLEFNGLFEVLQRLQTKLFRSFTTNGLLLDRLLPQVLQAAPNKVFVSIHFPKNAPEVKRVIRQVKALQSAGIRSGVNLLVRRSELPVVSLLAARLRANGIDNQRILYLPMKGADEPSAQEVASVGGPRFQSLSCLTRCEKSPRFVSIDASRRAAWCSYTTSRAPIKELCYASMTEALRGLGLRCCGESMARSLSKPRG